MLDSEIIDLSDIDIHCLYQAQGWQQKYKLLLRWGKLIPNNDAIRINQNKLDACEANTWVVCSVIEKNASNELVINFDSESSVVKGLAVLILYHCNGKPFSQVATFDLEALMAELQLTSHLSPSRVNGFLSFWKFIKSYCDLN